MQASQLCAANYHYKRYTLEAFLAAAERLGYQSIELWASGPHLHLEDYDGARLDALARSIRAHGLTLRCFTPEQCVYAISVSHPDKVYRDRTVDFFNRHIEASVRLGCDRMVVSTGFAYLDVDAEDAFGYADKRGGIRERQISCLSRMDSAPYPMIWQNNCKAPYRTHVALWLGCCWMQTARG